MNHKGQPCLKILRLRPDDASLAQNRIGGTGVLLRFLIVLADLHLQNFVLQSLV